MEINLFEEILSEKVHDFFRKQTFFTAIKKYTPEALKIIIDFLKKKGVKYETNDHASYYKYNNDIDYQKKTLDPQEKKELKKLGFKDNEIQMFDYPTIKLDTILSAVHEVTPYNYKDYKYLKLDEFKNYINNLSKEERDEFIKKIVNQIKINKNKLHRNLPDSINVDSKAFSATSNHSSSGDISFPAWTYQGFIIKVKINTNEEFFESGHDLMISIIDKSDDEQIKKEYSFKVNLINNIEKVLQEIWEASTKAVQMFKDGVEPEGKKEKETKRNKANPIIKEINSMLGKWFSTTKTGKIKQVGDYKLPAQIYAKYESTSSKGTGRNSKKGDRIILNIKIKGSRINDKSVEKIMPQALEWHKIYRGLLDKTSPNSGRFAYRNRNFSDMFHRYDDAKMLNDDHEKMFRRLKVVVKKLASYGFIPKSSSYGYGKGDFNKITFLYSEKAEKKYRDQGSEFIEKVFNSENFKNVEKGFFGNNIREKDVKRRYVQEVFKLHGNN